VNWLCVCRPGITNFRPVPQALRSLVGRYEAGEAVLDIRVGDWAALGQDAAKVRTAVFVQEQGITPDDEWDEADGSALHAVAYNALGQGIATGRLLSPVDGSGSARIGRMAVHRRPARFPCGAGHSSNAGGRRQTTRPC